MTDTKTLNRGGGGGEGAGYSSSQPSVYGEMR